MAKSVISGLTITIGADTAKFTTAMKNIDSEARRIAKDLKNVSESLKIDPGNSEAFANKLKLLQEAAGNATSRVEAIKKAIADLNRQYDDSKTRQDLYNQAVKDLKEALDQGKISQDSYKKSLEAVKEQYGKGNISQKEYEEALKKLERQLESANYEQARAVDTLDQYQRETSDTAKDVDKLGDEQKETNKEVEEFGNTAEDAGKKTFTLGDAIKANLIASAIQTGLRKIVDLAKSLAKHLADAGKALINFSWDAIGDAAAFKDALGYSVTIFGDTVSKQVQTWVNENTNALRIFKGDLLENMNTFGQLFQTMGLGAEDSFNMASKILSLAADLRAATGKDTPEILEALTDGFTTTTKTLRQFGVRINEAEIKLYALDKGIVKVDVDQTKLRDAILKVKEATEKQNDAFDKYGESSLEYERAAVNVQKAEDNLNKVLGGKVDSLTAAERTTAIYRMMLEQLAPVIGQNKEESGLFNSQLAETRTRLKNLKETIGEELLPTATNLLTTFNEFLDSEEGQEVLQNIIDQFSKWADTIDKMTKDGSLKKFIDDLIEKLPELAESIGIIVTDLLELTPRLSEFADKILGLLVSIDKLRLSRAWDNAEERIKLFADVWQLHTDTAKKAIVAFAEQNGIELYDVLTNFDGYEPKIIGYIQSIGSEASNMEETTSAALGELPDNIQTAINEANNISLTPLQSLAARVWEIVHNIVNGVDYAGNSVNDGPWQRNNFFGFSNWPYSSGGESGSYASGGIVSVGQILRVNDDAGHRVEAFIPSTDGYILNGNQVDRIVNNNNQRTVGDVNVYVSSYGMDLTTVSEELGNAIQNKLRSSGVIL